MSRLRPDAYDDLRRLKRLQHRDGHGLDGLMTDYLALADELEEIAPARDTDVPPEPSHRAA